MSRVRCARAIIRPHALFNLSWCWSALNSLFRWKHNGHADTGSERKILWTLSSTQRKLDRFRPKFLIHKKFYFSVSPNFFTIGLVVSFAGTFHFYFIILLLVKTFFIQSNSKLYSNLCYNNQLFTVTNFILAVMKTINLQFPITLRGGELMSTIWRCSA